MFSPLTVDHPGPTPEASTSMNWHEIESRFAKISGEVWAIWIKHDDSGLVSWSVYARDHEDRHVVARFLIEARLAGKMLERMYLSVSRASVNV